MKIQNKYVEIKIGDKTVKKHNFFMDNYISIFSRSQYSYTTRPASLNNILYIALDTPLNNITPDTTLNPNDFDMYITDGRLQTIRNSNNLSAICTFTNKEKFALNEIGGWNEYQDRTILDGRRITAISFDLKTFLDTSNYNLYFQGDEVLNISREDLITTDAIFTGDGDFPYHLDVENKYIEYELGGQTYTGLVKTRLYSVGLGHNIGKMEEEHIIGSDVYNVEVNVEDDFTYNFVITKAVDSGIYPGNTYPSTILHPKTFKIKVSIYPNTKLYSGTNLYPRVGDYKYVIMKYKNYYMDIQNVIHDLDDTYTMSFYTGKEGVLTVKDKIERSDA